MKTLLTLLLVSIGSIASGQSGSFTLDSSMTTQTNSYYRNPTITLCGLSIIIPIKSDSSVFTITDMQKLLRTDRNNFERIAKEWNVTPYPDAEFVPVMVTGKYWNEKYTFNEFRKLIYE